MSRFGLVRLSDVFRALNACAPGHRVELKKHHYWVYFNGKVFRGLPKGKGRNDASAQIEFGHGRKMCRALNIDLNCILGEFGRQS